MLDITATFTEALNNKLGADYIFSIEYGRKYDKVIQQSRNTSFGSHGSVHAFVERATGKLIKAATWASPQKDKDGLAYRYDISTPDGLAKAIEVADPYGSYLYKK